MRTAEYLGSKDAYSGLYRMDPPLYGAQYVVVARNALHSGMQLYRANRQGVYSHEWRNLLGESYDIVEKRVLAEYGYTMKEYAFATICFGIADAEPPQQEQQS